MAFVAVPNFGLGSPTVMPQRMHATVDPDAFHQTNEPFLTQTITTAPQFDAIIDPGTVASQYPVGYAG